MQSAVKREEVSMQAIVHALVHNQKVKWVMVFGLERHCFWYRETLPEELQTNKEKQWEGHKQRKN